MCSWMLFKHYFTVQLLHINIILFFPNGIHPNNPLWARCYWQAPMVRCRDWTTLLEGAQGAVLITVPRRVLLQRCVTAEPTPWVSFSRAPWLRAEGQTLKRALWSCQWSHGAHSVRDPQERIITDWLNDVTVWTALHQLVVKMGMTVFLWDICALGQGVDLKRCLCFQHVCRVFFCNHPAL